ncbi:hypothetical protein [Dyella jiangningensis]|uniref:Uncharacterized protein n=1 Tax=Dyella jiangningensis TaxID=1379159 RepID=A0A328P7N2_9GAMM|nr:hypothetical protein [Dyella jiangningensis]RAO76605.1 hypothetical protein CA260_01380 [Dyella jiangningensis]
MKPHKPHTKGHRVDWNDPRLADLLRRSENWKLDNRGQYDPKDVQIHLGWAANTARDAVLVWERDQVMMLETRFAIPVGEHVRVDEPRGETMRTAWGIVVEGREGFREEDRENGIHLYWLHLR